MKLKKFIYVLTHEYYKQYLKQGFYKFIPDKIFNRFETMIKPRIVCNFLGQNDENVRGYGIGVSLLGLKDNKDKFIQRLIEGLQKIEIQDVDKIILDDILLLDYNDINKIEDNCKLKLADGRKVLLNLAAHIIVEICKKSDKDIRNQEFLIIGGTSKDTKKLALEIAKEVNYLTIQGLEESCAYDIANEILINTGLSIHNTYDINNRLHKYNFILNLSSNPNVAINKIRKRAIVLDFGVGRGLSYDIRGLRRDIMVICDILLENTNDLLCTNEKIKFGKYLGSHIYEGINGTINKKNLIKIKIYPGTYTIKQACDVFLNANSNRTKLNVNY